MVKTSVSETIRKPLLIKDQTAFKNPKKIKYGKKRFSIRRMELLHPAMWHDHDILPGDYTRQCDMWLWNHDSEFTKWQHPAMWHIALGSWHWIRQVAAPGNVAVGSGMICHGIRPNVRHIGILHLVSILTISSQSTCNSAPVCKILSKSDHPQQKEMTLCQFSRWPI